MFNLKNHPLIGFAALVFLACFSSWVIERKLPSPDSEYFRPFSWGMWVGSVLCVIRFMADEKVKLDESYGYVLSCKGQYLTQPAPVLPVSPADFIPGVTKEYALEFLSMDSMDKQGRWKPLPIRDAGGDEKRRMAELMHGWMEQKGYIVRTENHGSFYADGWQGNIVVKANGLRSVTLPPTATPSAAQTA